MCISPIWRPRRGRVDHNTLLFEPAPKADGLEPLVDEGVRGWYVPCGKCFECLKRRKNDWFVRALKEFTHCYKRDGYGRKRHVYMVTFTFNQDNLPENTPYFPDPAFPDIDQSNLERSHYRKILSAKIRAWKDVIRKRLGYFPVHWLVTERGDENNRLHLHGILICRDLTDYELIRSSWKYGYSWVENLRDLKGISYSLKYMLKGLMERVLFDDYLAGLVYCSHGFGSSYLSEGVLRYIWSKSNYSYQSILTLSECNGFKYATPRYFIKKACQFFGHVKYPSLTDYLSLIEDPPSKSRHDLWFDYRDLTLSFNQTLRKYISFA